MGSADFFVVAGRMVLLLCLRVARHPEMPPCEEVLPLAKNNFSKTWNERRELGT
jgi:hypothetical protein